jgi:hypothetical protein
MASRVFFRFPSRQTRNTLQPLKNNHKTQCQCATWLTIGLTCALAPSLLADGAAEWRQKMAPIMPRGYLCHYAAQPLVVDGNLDEAAWAAAPWTSDFVDIEDAAKPKPRFRTHAKLLWDDNYLYIGAEIQEPHVWATLTQHDSVIFQDPDFEVFISPTGGTQPYYEFEMNALNTSWDLLLDKPYMDGGQAHNEWDIPGLKTAVQVHGTINQPADIDTNWTVEIAFPWSVLSQRATHAGPPREGEQWRIDFSRVEWQITTNGGVYQKVPNTPENNWVWSPTGVIDMHRPEMWGQLQFTRKTDRDAAAITPLPGKAARDAALEVYYAQHQFFDAHKRWAATLEEAGVGAMALPDGSQPPTMQTTPDGYICAVKYQDDTGHHVWRVRQDRLLKLDKPLPIH